MEPQIYNCPTTATGELILAGIESLCHGAHATYVALGSSFVHIFTFHP